MAGGRVQVLRKDRSWELFDGVAMMRAVGGIVCCGCWKAVHQTAGYKDLQTGESSSLPSPKEMKVEIYQMGDIK